VRLMVPLPELVGPSIVTTVTMPQG